MGNGFMHADTGFILGAPPKYDDELIPSKTAYQVVTSQVLFQLGNQGKQCLVANEVAVGIIELFEIIDIK